MDETAATASGEGVLLIARSSAARPSDELFLVVGADGEVVAYNGHVDLGTGIQTALAQVVAEELDVGLPRVRMVLGDLRTGPDQGATIASTTIQVTARPLRAAAAQARRFLLARAAEEMGRPADALRVEDGVIRAGDDANRFLSYGDLLRGRRVRLELDADTPTKPVSEHRVVGQAVPRVDIPAKATGGLVHVHDLRLLGMLHGRVVRPPYAGLDHGEGVGTSLVRVDEASVADVPGLVAVVREGDFVGVVAEREEYAAFAADRLRVAWKPGPRLPDLHDLPTALRANPSTPRILVERGDVDAAISGAAVSMRRTYVWPYQMHASIGPSCAVADFRDGTLTVWSGTQAPGWLRTDLALLLGIPEAAVTIVRMEAAGCYGRNCADDVTADAALLSRATRRPVRVQLTRQQEHAWEPKGAAQVMDAGGGIDVSGNAIAYDFATRYPSNRAPTLALLLTGRIAPTPAVGDVGDRTAIPPYRFDAMRVVVHDMPPIARAAFMRGVSALPNTFAHESFMDELATAAGEDPVAFRLRHLPDERAADLVRATAARAGWEPRTGPRRRVGTDGVAHGQGFAYARYVHSTFPGFGASWSAWVADVAVDTHTGEVTVTRVTAGQDTGLMINPDGVRHQLHGNVIQSISRTLKEEVRFDAAGVRSLEWGAYPIITFPELPAAVDTVLMSRPDDPPLGAGESASVPSAAAIANAIFDATGVRFREVPFTPERIRAGLEAATCPPAPPAAPRRRWPWVALAGIAGVAVGTAVAALPWRAAIPPAGPLAAGTYSEATIERGRALVALGDCAVCHTAPDSTRLAGGHRLETPFGTIVTPNITPDPGTGIGRWSYAAFERAMREGIHRDGHHLYPAFPYVHFARVADADLQAIYAYLMAQPPVRAPHEPGTLRFPFNLRPLVGAWNALFHRPAPFRPDPARSEAWNRGAYLVEGLGHCAGCHSPRNAFGASRAGGAHLAGGTVQGWDAPPLNALSHAPLRWTEDDFYDYLRTGYARRHGVAAGPMAEVVRELAGAPDADLRAMATYLVSLSPPVSAGEGSSVAALRLEAATGMLSAGSDVGARLYEGACAACHAPDRSSSLFGVRPSLALNSNVHGASPDNLIRVILNGIAHPAHGDLGAMPGFRDTLDDEAMASLLRHLRTRFAPGRQSWTEIEESVARVRAERRRP